jgi:hypothetical protein
LHFLYRIKTIYLGFVYIRDMRLKFTSASHLCLKPAYIFAFLLYTVFFLNRGLGQANYFNYQLSIRDKNGNPMSNRQIAIRSEIVNGTFTTIYQEIFFGQSTGNFGIINLRIGDGQSQFGTFPNPERFASGDLKLRIAIDTNNGTSFLNLSAFGENINSVPSALFSKKAPGTVVLSNMGGMVSLSNQGLINDITIDTGFTNSYFPKLFMNKANNVLSSTSYSLLSNAAATANRLFYFNPTKNNWQTSKLTFLTDTALGIGLGTNAVAKYPLDIFGKMRYRPDVSSPPSNNYLALDDSGVVVAKPFVSVPGATNWQITGNYLEKLDKDLGLALKVTTGYKPIGANNAAFTISNSLDNVQSMRIVNTSSLPNTPATSAKPGLEVFNNFSYTGSSLEHSAIKGEVNQFSKGIGVIANGGSQLDSINKSFNLNPPTYGSGILATGAIGVVGKGQDLSPTFRSVGGYFYTESKTGAGLIVENRLVPPIFSTDASAALVVRNGYSGFGFENFMAGATTSNADKPNSTLDVNGTFATRTVVEDLITAAPVGSTLIPEAHHIIVMYNNSGGSSLNYILPDPSTVMNREYIIELFPAQSAATMSFTLTQNGGATSIRNFDFNASALPYTSNYATSFPPINRYRVTARATTMRLNALPNSPFVACWVVFSEKMDK